MRLQHLSAAGRLPALARASNPGRAVTMDGKAQLIEAISDYITTGAGAGILEGAGPDTRLGEEGLGLDSIDFLQLFLRLEAVAGVDFRDEELTPDTVASLGALAAYVRTHGRT